MVVPVAASKMPGLLLCTPLSRKNVRVARGRAGEASERRSSSFVPSIGAAVAVLDREDDRRLLACARRSVTLTIGDADPLELLRFLRDRCARP